MKVALVKLPPTYSDWDKRPFLGIGYIGAYLKAHGINCRIFDASFHLWSEMELINRIVEFSPEIIGFTVMTHEIVRCSGLASKIKEKLNIPIIIGGCHVTALPERTLKEFPVFDYGVFGEGEKTMLELVKFLEGSNSSRPENINGLIYKHPKEKICINSPRQPMSSSELDELPFPDFRDYYDEPGALSGRNSYYYIFTSRGCPFSCAFCMQVMGKLIRQRSITSVVQEIEYAISHFGAHTIDFSDEIFLFNNKRTRELLQSIIERNWPEKVRWSGLARANLVTTELVSLAKKAGCYRIGLGVESGDDGILKQINKGITVDQTRNAIRIIKEHGIQTETYFILGHPNETKETIKKTIRLAGELDATTISVGLMVPYPGTRIYEMARNGEGGYRLLSENWTEYDKYGGRVLELKGVTYKELSKFQVWAFIYFYLKNYRFVELIKFFLKYKRGVFFLFKKMVARGFKRKNLALAKNGIITNN